MKSESRGAFMAWWWRKESRNDLHRERWEEFQIRPLAPVQYVFDYGGDQQLEFNFPRNELRGKSGIRVSCPRS